MEAESLLGEILKAWDGLEKILWVAAIYEIHRKTDEGKKEAFKKSGSALKM